MNLEIFIGCGGQWVIASMPEATPGNAGTIEALQEIEASRDIEFTLPAGRYTARAVWNQTGNPTDPDYEVDLQDVEPVKESARVGEVLEAAYNDLRAPIIQFAQKVFQLSQDEAARYTDAAFPVFTRIQAAIARAKGEA